MVGQRRAAGPAEHRLPVLEREGEPARRVKRSVMAATQEQQIRKCRGATVGPMNDVMGVAPGLRAIASWKPAMAITDHDGSANRWRHDRGASPNIERLGLSG